MGILDRVLRSKQRDRSTRAKTPAGVQSSHENPHPLPSVNQMMVAGGQGYNWSPTASIPAFITPTPVSSRIQTPIVRVGASLQLSTNVTPGDRGRMWCK